MVENPLTFLDRFLGDISSVKEPTNLGDIQDLFLLASGCWFDGSWGSYLRCGIYLLCELSCTMIPVPSSSSPVSGTRWRHLHCFETIFPSPLPRLELSVYIFQLFFLLLSGVGMISRKITSSVCFWTAKFFAGFWCQFIGARWNDVTFLFCDITVVLRSTQLIQCVRSMHFVRNDVFLPGNYFWTYETFDGSCHSLAVNFFRNWRKKVSKNLFMASVGFLWIHSVKKPICQNSFWIRIKDSRTSICVSQADIRSNERKLCSKCSESYGK